MLDNSIWKQLMIRSPFFAFYKFWFSNSYLFRLASIFHSWRLYNICTCKSAAFVSSLLISYYLMEKTVVAVLTTYFTGNWKTSNIVRDAATLKNIHGALSTIFFLIWTCVSETKVGRLRTVLYSSASYMIGLLLLSFYKQIPNSLFWPFNTIVVIFLAVGKGGSEPLKKFLSDQLRNHQPEKFIEEDQVEAQQKVWRRVAWFISAILVLFVFNRIGWTKTFAASASAMGITYFVFSYGIKFYHFKDATDNNNNASRPLSDILLTVVASFRRLQDPQSPLEQYYQNEKNEDDINGAEEQEQVASNVFAILIASLPIFTIFFPPCTAVLLFGLGISTADTFFFEQANNLDYKIPELLFLLLPTISGFLISFLCNLIVLKWSPGAKKKRKWMILRSWIGMFLLVICFVVAWRVEIHRLKIVNNPDNGDIPMSNLWLAPQFILLGQAEVFVRQGLDDLYMNQVPKSLQSYGPILNELFISGFGNLLCIILVQSLRSWFPSNSKGSHLDNYYLLVAILNFTSLGWWISWTFYTGYLSEDEKQEESEQSNPRLMAPAKIH